MAPNLHVFQETAVEAFPMAIVGFAVAFSVAKVYSVKHDYTIDGNQVQEKVLYNKKGLIVTRFITGIHITVFRQSNNQKCASPIVLCSP